MITAIENKPNDTTPYARQFAGSSNLAALILSPLLSAITSPLTNGPIHQTSFILPPRAV